MEQKFWLLSSLVEYQDCVSDGHSLYKTLEKAQEAFEKEVEECLQNFIPEHGEYVLDLPRCKEWREEFGTGFTVTLEEIIPQ